MRRLRLPALALLIVLAVGLALPSCRTTVPNRDPSGEIFPTVAGEGLDGEVWTLPEDLAGQPAVLLVGYVQDTQFDLDRWLLGLLQAETPGQVLEVPTIPGLVPGMFRGQIDGGMRSGIPSEDWGSVVTVYGDEAERIVTATGNERPRNGRVMVLDAKGRIVWFHDRGYSATKVLELDTTVRQLADEDGKPDE